MNRNSFKKLILLSFMLALLFSLAGCTTFNDFKAEFFSDEGNTVKVGIYEPLSGTDKKNASIEIEGIELANGMYPTVDGKKVELVYVDNKSDIGSAESCVQTLINKDVKVILGSYGNANSLAIAEYIDKAQIPAITMTNTNPIITSSSDYYFRTCYVDTYQGIAMAEYAYNGLKTKKAALMVPEGDEKATAISQRFMAKFIKLSGKKSSIVENIVYSRNETDFTKQLKKIKKSGARAVFLPSSSKEAGLILKQANEMGITACFLGTDEWDVETIIEDAGMEAASKAVYTKVKDSITIDKKSKTIEEFKEAYHNLYGKENDPDSAVALGYDAYMIAIKAIAKAGSDATGEEIKKAIMNTGEYSGASGYIYINSKGDVIKSVAIYSIDTETKKSEIVYVVEAKSKSKK